MAIFVDVELDLEGAQEGIDDFQDKASKTFQKLGKDLGDALKVDKIRGAFEGLKSGIDQSLSSVDKADQKLKLLLDKSLTTGAAVSKIGELFGPIGAIAGGAIGAAIGFVEELWDSEKKAADEARHVQEEMKKIGAETDRLIAKFGDFDGLSLDQLIGNLGNVNDKLQETIGLIKKGDAEMLAYVEQNEALRKIQEDNLDAAGRSLVASMETTINAIGEVEDRSTKTTSQLADEAEKAKKKLDKAKEDLSDLYTQINDTLGPDKIAFHDDSEEAKKATQNYKELSASIARYSADYDTAQDEIEARRKKAGTDAKKADAELLAATKELYDRQAEIEQQAFDRDQAATEAKWAAEEKAQQDALDEMTKQHNFAIALNQARSDREREDRLQLQAFKRQLAAEDAAALKQEYEQQKAYYDALLNTVAGPVLNELTSTIGANIEAGNRAFEGFGKAAKRGISEAEKALAHQFLAQAEGEFAAALASLALGPVGGLSAGQHFAASVAYGAAAALAGVAGARSARGTGAAPSTSSAGAGGGGSTSTPLGAGERSPQRLAPIIQYLGGGPGSTNIYAGDNEKSRIQAARELDKIQRSGARAGSSGVNR